MIALFPKNVKLLPADLPHVFFSLRSSTCVTRTVGGSRTCAATTPASTRSSGSATGTTTSTVPTLLIGQFPTSVLDLHIFFHGLVAGTTWTTWPTEPTRPLPRRREGVEAGTWTETKTSLSTRTTSGSEAWKVCSSCKIPSLTYCGISS